MQIAARIEPSGAAEASQPWSHRYFAGVRVGAVESYLVMHRVEEHARGLRLDRRDVGIRLPAELCQRSAQRASVTDIDEIEAVIDRVHVGVELGVGTRVESARDGKPVAAAGARPIGQRRVADRLQIYVILDGDELRIGAAWLGADADQPLL